MLAALLVLAALVLQNLLHTSNADVGGMQIYSLSYAWLVLVAIFVDHLNLCKYVSSNCGCMHSALSPHVCIYY